jgi:hypothetical protein
MPVAEYHQLAMSRVTLEKTLRRSSSRGHPNAVFKEIPIPPMAFHWTIRCSRAGNRGPAVCLGGARRAKGADGRGDGDVIVKSCPIVPRKRLGDSERLVLCPRLHRGSDHVDQISSMTPVATHPCEATGRQRRRTGVPTAEPRSGNRTSVSFCEWAGPFHQGSPDRFGAVGLSSAGH